MQHFDDALKERLEATPDQPDVTTPDPAAEAARDALAAKLLDAGKEHSLKINRIKQIYTRLEELDNKGAHVDEIRALELEFQQLAAPSPPSYRASTSVGATKSGLRGFWHSLLSDEPVRRP